MPLPSGRPTNKVGPVEREHPSEGRLDKDGRRGQDQRLGILSPTGVADGVEQCSGNHASCTQTPHEQRLEEQCPASRVRRGEKDRGHANLVRPKDPRSMASILG